MRTEHGVTMHRESYGGVMPAVNVKIHDFSGYDEARAALEARGVDPEVAEKAVEWADEANRETFWEQAQDDAEFYLCKRRMTGRYSRFGFSPSLRIEQQGRSGGWLVVAGIGDDPTEWNRAQRVRWHRFERAMRENVRYFTSAEGLLEIIDANDWCEGIARQNEIDRKVAEYRKQLEAEARNAA